MAETATSRRRHAVLSAIVADYIATNQPVGSKALVQRHQLGVSPATIRNDMAALEAEGYIKQQHASSGRIPTTKAYRAFVDQVHAIKPLSGAEKRAILTFLQDGVDVEDVLRRSVQLLSGLTGTAAVVQLPTLAASHVRHVEVVHLTPTRLLLVVITDTGRVEQRNVELVHPIEADAAARVRDELNRALVGRTLPNAAHNLDAVVAATAGWDAAHRDSVARSLAVLRTTLVERPADKLIVAGAANTLQIDESVLEALEEQVIMLKLLSAATAPGEVHVSIGQENADQHFKKASVIATSYGAPEEETAIGGMAVVGPTAMDYVGTMSKVHAVATYVSRVLTGG
ncbi:heat-inducible transcriptional repressor HrcA [Corynebacterium sp. 13CS0277]|uniref:heat-inducible transcriptional repressor HrcA n=1 Tax=Corynebacterium sp. 13CS0277 TaxID=2071994 RepID=UPI000D0453BB|nr:heat-inducible transcriptional repressor HrcA [Corynebacterium sp. 13CS0277]PRQ10912.1 heat-inducible transcriptional repressor HrcA [Corynebacterium sp. 13CS0277]